jgi:hypothetical protein
MEPEMRQSVLGERSIFFVTGRNAVTNVVTCVGYLLVTVGYRIGYSVGYIMPTKMTCRPRKFRVLMHDKGPRILPAVELPVDFLENHNKNRFEAFSSQKQGEKS